MAITVKGVCFSYGRTRVLHDIDWIVRRGVTGLLGPNGSGKTTLLSVLVGLLRPSTGSVVPFVTRSESTVESGTESTTGGRVRGREGRHASTGRGEPRFGYVPQRFSLAGGMQVVDAVAYTAWMNGTPRGECEPAAVRALAAVDLADKARVNVKTLSGGQRQRAGIAAGLAHDPDVLVLDEPTVGLDPEQRLRVRDMIADIGESRTVVVSTHLLDEVSALCRRVGVLSAGRLVFDGTVDELETTDVDGDVGGDVVEGGTDGSSDDDGRGDRFRGDARRSPIERGYQRLLKTVGGTE